MLAMRYESDTDTIRMLVRAGANVNAQDADGWTALMWAASLDHLGGARTLLEAGVDWRPVDHQDGRSAEQMSPVGAETRALLRSVRERAALDAVSGTERRPGPGAGAPARKM